MIVNDGFEKKTLKDIAPYFKMFEVWEESDVKFALKLTQIRNGIAHKNGKKLHKGPHGGIYYLTSTGKKVYIKH